MQGDHIAMIEYKIGVLPIIKNKKRAIPDVTQPWYADDARSLGLFARLETYFDSVTLLGPGWGYHPEPSKSVLIVLRDNLEVVKVFGARHGFRVCIGARYLGGYSADDKSKRGCLRDCTLMG